MTLDLGLLTRNQLIDLIQRAKQRRLEVEKEHQIKVREEILLVLKAEGYSLEQLFGPIEATCDAAATKSGKSRRPATPKYYNPGNRSQVWTGRGKFPRWFQAALESGKTAQDLLIK